MVNPTGYTALDLIGYTDKGAYNSASTYVRNDLVHYNSSIWRCLVDDTTAVTPVEGAAWTIFIQEPGVMTGATSGAAGASGLAPTPSAGDQGKFLRGDGTWNDPPLPADMTGATSLANGTHGLVPAPLIAEKDGFLKGDGTWGNPTAAPMVGATASVDGVGGSVPAPLMGYQDRVLSGAGTWVDSVLKDRVLVLATSSAVSALPYDFTNSAIETDMVCVKAYLSNPAAQTGEWTVNTDTAGRARISGNISGSTNITIYLAKSR